MLIYIFFRLRVVLHQKNRKIAESQSRSGSGVRAAEWRPRVWDSPADGRRMGLRGQCCYECFDGNSMVAIFGAIIVDDEQW